MSDAGDHSESEERRRHVRMAVHWSGDLEASGDRLDCTVLDISPSGAKVQSSDPLPPETPVILTLAQGDQHRGAIVWQQGSFMGIGFDPAAADQAIA